jgi:hypothetical protein
LVGRENCVRVAGEDVGGDRENTIVTTRWKEKPEKRIGSGVVDVAGDCIGVYEQCFKKGKFVSFCTHFHAHSHAFSH